MKPLSREDRTRMARDREDMLLDNPSPRERQEIEAEIALLQDARIEVGFNGNDVVRL